MKGNNAAPQQNTPTGRVEVPTQYKRRLSTTNKNVSYAQVATRGIAKAPLVDMNSDKKLDEILKLMSSFDERLKKIENSNKAATSKPQK